MAHGSPVSLEVNKMKKDSPAAWQWPGPELLAGFYHPPESQRALPVHQTIPREKCIFIVSKLITNKGVVNNILKLVYYRFPAFTTCLHWVSICACCISFLWIFCYNGILLSWLWFFFPLQIIHSDLCVIANKKRQTRTWANSVTTQNSWGLSNASSISIMFSCFNCRNIWS